MIQWLTSISVSLVLAAAPAVSQDASTAKKKKGVDPQTATVNQMMKQLEIAELSAEQKEKVQAMMTKTASEVFALRKEKGVTPEMMKSRNEAAKKAREEGKKAKEVREIGLAAMGATEDQIQCVIKTEEMLAIVKVEIGKILSDDQKAKLPKQLQTAMKEKAGGKKS